MIDKKISNKFRYDINALRAIAVIGVLLFHYKISFLSGGFSGVDVFFVISGYLMSKIIFTSINKGNFSIVSFYSRRVKRIVPPLLALITVVTIACFFIYFPEEYKENEKNAASSIIFLSNILYWKSSSYFAPASDTNIFLHTWSLSVEWQFYLLYPVALLFFNRAFKNKGIYVLVFLALTLIFLIASVNYTHLHPTPSFYLLPNRAWEMLIGGVAFFTEDRVKHKGLRILLAVVGYLSIFLCFIFFNDSMTWPGKFTIVPVFATFIIIIANLSDARILKNAGIQFFGRISYSLYLWHWPVFVIGQYIGLKLYPGTIVALIGLSILLAYLSYKYIESIDFETSTILVLMLVLLVVTGCLSQFNANNVLFKRKSLTIAYYKKNNSAMLDKQFSVGGCFISSKQAGIKDFDKQHCLNFEKGKKNILLIGDSHAAELSESFKEIFLKNNTNVLQATSSGCLPLLRENGEYRCSAFINYIYKDFIVSHAGDIDGVILSADWVNANIDERPQLVHDINETIKYIEKYHIKTLIVGQSETFTIPYSSIAAREYEYGISISHNYLNKDSYLLNRELKEKLAPVYIDIYNYNKIPSLSQGSVPYMFDSNHFTKYGADLTVNKLILNKEFIKFFLN